jgi:hypothetical protein
MEAVSDTNMNLKKIIWPYKEKKNSGLLSVKVEGQEHLLNIYFNLGIIVGLSMGTLKNEACLDILSNCHPMNAIFMQGYKTPNFVTVDNASINNKLEVLFAAYPITGSTKTGSDAQTVSVSATDLHKLEDEFIDIMGPIGRMILNTSYLELGYHLGTDMPSSMFSRLIDGLRGELPSQHQSTFTAKYAMGLALYNLDE